MCGMGAIGLVEATIFMGTLSIGGAAVGTSLALGGTMGPLKLSKICAGKEKECEPGSAKALAYKIAKWASVGAAGLLGTGGAALAGLSAFVLITSASWGQATPLAIVAGVTTGLFLEAYVLKHVVKQSQSLNT